MASISARAAAPVERFLDEAGFERGPWLAVAFGAGIAAWFALPAAAQWLGLILAALGTAAVAALVMRGQGRHPFLRRSVIMMALALAAGCACVWAKSLIAGTPPIAHFAVADLAARVLAREDRPAEGRIVLTLATREPGAGRPIRVRINLPPSFDRPGMAEGATIKLRARLMPPRPPQLPGAHDFAREAWFGGLAATGSALGPPVVVTPGGRGERLGGMRRGLAAHVRAAVPGSAGGIAAAFASGDRGGIGPADEQAMRDAGLTHLLSVSGLHVSAVVGVVWLVAIRLLALAPWLALRVRLPLMASVAGALAAVAYTVLTGSEVPTVRSCLGALLVMAALAVGRSPLSMRLLAAAAMATMLFWPEAVIGPSFQMSFGSVLAIVAVAESAPARAFLAHRGEGALARACRHLVMILLTGLVIECALMPIALYHFHRAGVYGAIANVAAIPLTTFVTMPLIGLALALDLAGLGAPAWWGVDASLRLLLAIAHATAARPGAVSLLPVFGAGAFVLFNAGTLWLALWRGRVRLWGLVPVLAGIVWLAMVRPPDLLLTGDGHNLGVVDAARGRLLILREGRSTFTRDYMMAAAGMAGEVVAIEDWPGARCTRDLCAIRLDRGGRVWRLLVVRRTAWTLGIDLRAACVATDIVIAPQKIEGECRPAMARIDKTLLLRTGGMAFDLAARQVRTVAESEGAHPWWRFPTRMARDPDAEGVLSEGAEQPQ